MSPGVSIVPFVLVPLTFVFVLLIILVAKAPKAGAWIVGGLVLLAPGVLVRLVQAGSLAQKEAIPLFLVPATFLFVLLVVLTAKAPKVGVALIVAVVALLVLGFFVALPVISHRSVHAATAVARPVAPAPPQAPSPIWSEGIENEFEADIYPSRLSAARALGSRMEKAVRMVTGSGRLPDKIVLFREEHDHELVAAFEKTMRAALEAVPCAVETNLRNLDPNEVGVVLRFVDREGRLSTHDEARGGAIEAKALAGGQPTSIQVRFSEKPWLDDFARYLSERPDSQIIVARSQETCTDENEARQQAMQDACNQLSAIAGQKWTPLPGRLPLTVTPQDLQEGGFILDQFVQGFDGSAGKIWRQAMLIDNSADKLAWLNDRKNAEMHVERVTWARLVLSAFGVLVVIVAAYLFLNMATKGYYEWTLRIAGTVLAIAGILSIFLVLR